jgi:hypothetical protein
VSAELDKCYELLGVKPGASVAELKAAYRDMAKVWHPDRFGHDERLQKKAQDKLKEINEAYELLISGKTPRPRPSAPNYEAQESAPYSKTPEAKAGKPMKWQWAAVPLMIFVAIFFAATQLRKSDAPVAEPTEQHQAQAVNETTTAASSANQVGTEQRNKKPEAEVRREVSANDSTTPVAPVQAMATVTVLIDPATGLLAKADCPTKTRMTYPSGNEPHGYCNAVHSGSNQAPKESSEAGDSKVKAIAKRVISPNKWLGSNKEKSEGDRQE